MKKLALLALALGAMGGCWNLDTETSDSIDNCVAIGPPDGHKRSCSFVAPPFPAYACQNITSISFDLKRLPSKDYAIQCSADGTGQITVFRDDAACVEKFVLACID